jgi:hypothetical protein
VHGLKYLSTRPNFFLYERSILVSITCGQYYETFLCIVYATSMIFPYDLNLGYADSDVITWKKV